MWPKKSHPIGNFLEATMKQRRLEPVMKTLTNDTVLGELLDPVVDALDRVRYQPKVFRGLKMGELISLGVLRHLQGVKTLREQVQKLFHLAPDETSRPPLARSTWSDALRSGRRSQVLHDVVGVLVEKARSVLPDRLAAIPGLGDRLVCAIDGTYQQESAHYGRRTPRQGGDDNPKGHGLLTMCDVRMGCAVESYVETRNQHELHTLRDYEKAPQAWTHKKNVLWLVDRGLISAPLWDAKKRKLKSTVITRMKSRLVVEHAEDRDVAAIPENRDVVRDETIALCSSSETWRRVTFCNDAGEEIVFLTNELALEPGVIAFLYLRRWDVEKCFDMWKNDFSQAKAWGKDPVAIQNQTYLAIITHLLLAMLLHEKAEPWGIGDEKALKKQAIRHEEVAHRDGTAMWFTKVYRYTSKISKQVLRFFEDCFLKQASPELYDNQLKPLLERYL